MGYALQSLLRIRLMREDRASGELTASRQAVGLPMQGTIVSKVDMFGNRYPLEDALKLFGAMPGKGAQAIK